MMFFNLAVKIFGRPVNWALQKMLGADNDDAAALAGFVGMFVCVGLLALTIAIAIALVVYLVWRYV